ncbi:hypothetical protein PHLGIDRAFT_265618 [Phlebiopsis gigantea 11061_1 CR5-6]|uniref:Uncharacterized protein n=1 Tax=Phlebiopsis gigantea (strain 11061_1 CR5-6) TaxID=745531 RepID=A0A0C3NXQ4_PHLG1|nr:hypothetical protein PHLGIDRAFT_265618 [Phlebiopsis gigantea 11061_1 CR5-6]
MSTDWLLFLRCHVQYLLHRHVRKRKSPVGSLTETIDSKPALHPRDARAAPQRTVTECVISSFDPTIPRCLFAVGLHYNFEACAHRAMSEISRRRHTNYFSGLGGENGPSTCHRQVECVRHETSRVPRECWPYSSPARRCPNRSQLSKARRTNLIIVR